MENMIQLPDKQNRVRIIKSYKNGSKLSTLLFCIPKDIAKAYDIEKPANLYLIPRKDGILLTKVPMEGIQ